MIFEVLPRTKYLPKEGVFIIWVNKERQFNFDKRAVLERMVSQGRKAKEISTVLGMDPTSVSSETA